MLGLSHSLLFPRLRWIREAKLRDKSFTDENIFKDIQLFELDWDHFPKLEGFQMIPFEYDYLTKHTFAISPAYLQEIHHQSQLAMMEWSKRRPFDTSIREFCLQPSIAAISAAMHLLGDSCYDHETKFFSRDPERKLLTKYALMWKFWSVQTGMYQVSSNSEIRTLREVYGDREIAQKFLKAVDELEKEWDGLRKNKSEPGPAIGAVPKNEPIIGWNYPASECFLTKDGKAFVRLERSLFEIEDATYETFDPEEGIQFAKKYGTKCRLLGPADKKPEDLRGWMEVNISNGPLKGHKAYFRRPGGKAIVGEPKTIFNQEMVFTSDQVVNVDGKPSVFVKVKRHCAYVDYVVGNTWAPDDGSFVVTLMEPNANQQISDRLPSHGWTQVRIWEGKYEGYHGGFIEVPMVKKN